jgi:hypothetical protein
MTPRSERSITEFTEVNIELIRQLIEKNPHSNYKKLELWYQSIYDMGNYTQ